MDEGMDRKMTRGKKKRWMSSNVGSKQEAGKAPWPTCTYLDVEYVQEVQWGRWVYMYGCEEMAFSALLFAAGETGGHAEALDVAWL